MTNEEKAREILFELERYDTFSVLNCINKMAEWKDQQFKEYLKKMQKEFTDDEAGYYVINRIINELFGGK